MGEGRYTSDVCRQNPERMLGVARLWIQDGSHTFTSNGGRAFGGLPSGWGVTGAGGDIILQDFLTTGTKNGNVFQDSYTGHLEAVSRGNIFRNNC